MVVGVTTKTPTCGAERSNAQLCTARQAVEAVVLKKLPRAVLGWQQCSLHNLVVDADGRTELSRCCPRRVRKER